MNNALWAPQIFTPNQPSSQPRPSPYPGSDLQTRAWRAAWRTGPDCQPSITAVWPAPWCWKDHGYHSPLTQSSMAALRRAPLHPRTHTRAHTHTQRSRSPQREHLPCPCSHSKMSHHLLSFPFIEPSSPSISPHPSQKCQQSQQMVPSGESDKC